MHDLSAGSTIAGCRLESVAGRGGMGVVWRATQLALDRPVALKAIAPQLAQDPAFRERFQRESQIAASIDHANVIPVYEAGESDGVLYLIMRWVDGTDLRAMLRAHGRLEPSRALRLLRPVAAALSASHRRGLIHRDVKPANVLLATAEDDGDEHVYLTDFGIARRTQTRGVTRTGVLVGTLDYMAPERIEGGSGSPTSDIYAFGCMLFEALTGRVPFERPTEIAKMFAHLNEPPPESGTSPRLDAIIAKAMAKRPEDRFATAAELVAALDEATTTESDAVQPTVLSGEAGARATVPGGLGDEPTPVTIAPTAPAPPSVEPTVPATPGAEPTALAASSAEPTALAASSPEPTALAASSAEPTVTAATAPQPSAPAVQPGRTATTLEADLRPERPAAPRSRSRVLVLIALVAIVAAAAVVAVLSSGGGSGGGSAPPASATAAQPAVLLGPGTVRLHPPIALPSAATALAAAGSTVWAATPETLLQVTPTGVASRSPIDGVPSAAAADPQGRVWLTGIGAGGVSASGAVVVAGQGSNAITISGQAAWIAGSGTNQLSRVDLNSTSQQTVRVGGPAVAALGAAYARIWVAAPDGTVTVLNEDGSANALSAPAVAPGTVGVAQSNGVWFLSSSGSLNRIDPRGPPIAQQGRYVAHPVPVRVGAQAAGIGALQDDNSVWVLSRSDRLLTRIGTAGSTDNQVIARIRFPAAPGHLTVGDHLAWVDIPSTRQLYAITF